ncbi:MAG: hypothetical protein PHN57_00325 [Candidatus Omnitrophica bacterium]|nr:hypothetical protein [Candidatus Omnitrophota bacterium]
MKKVYNLGDDLFLAAAFVSFMIGSVLRLLDIQEIGLGITSRALIVNAIICLLFSIALSLYDLAQRQSK